VACETNFTFLLSLSISSGTSDSFVVWLQNSMRFSKGLAKDITDNTAIFIGIWSNFILT